MANETKGMLYCDKPKLLQECLEKAKTHSFEVYIQPDCSMEKLVNGFLQHDR